MQRPRLVRAAKNEATGSEHAIEFERDFPRHRQMLKHRQRKRRDEALTAEQLFEFVRVAHDIDVGTGQDVQAHVVELRWDERAVG